MAKNHITSVYRRNLLAALPLLSPLTPALDKNDMKNLILTICMIVLSNFSVSYGQLNQKKQESLVKTMVQEFKLQKTIDQIENGKIEPDKLNTIYLVLQNTNEYYIHNLNGAKGNQVYLHKDGHKEAVYAKDGKLVKDGINDGSYNYFHPVNQPLLHFTFDIHPWIKWGNSRKDTTTKEKRIFKYVSDIEGGIRRALKDYNKKGKNLNFKWKKTGQLQSLAIFVLALKQEELDTLYQLVNGTLPITNKNIIRVLKNLDMGLNKLY